MISVLKKKKLITFPRGLELSYSPREDSRSACLHINQSVTGDVTTKKKGSLRSSTGNPRKLPFELYIPNDFPRIQYSRKHSAATLTARARDIRNRAVIKVATIGFVFHGRRSAQQKSATSLARNKEGERAAEELRGERNNRPAEPIITLEQSRERASERLGEVVARARNDSRSGRIYTGTSCCCCQRFVVLYSFRVCIHTYTYIYKRSGDILGH